MTHFVFKRLVHAAVSLVGMTILVFILLRISGDPAALLLPLDATPDQVKQMRSALGLDQPLPYQYALFFKRAISGDFGTSFRFRQPAMVVVLQFVPATVELAAAGLFLATMIAIPLGIISAVRKGTAVDTLATVLAVLGQSVPIFWLGILFILIFAVLLGWLPAAGRGGLSYLVLPSITLGWYMSALLTRLVRSAMLEILTEDYIRTARAKGLSERAIIWKHALRNAAIPVVTVWGMQLGALLTGAVVTETVFAWPGLGRTAINAVYGRDYPVVMASVVVFAFVFVVINLLVDLSYGLLDPRIRYG